MICNCIEVRQRKTTLRKNYGNGSLWMYGEIGIIVIGIFWVLKSIICLSVQAPSDPKLWGDKAYWQ